MADEKKQETKEEKVSAKLTDINYQEDIHKPTLESLAEEWSEDEERLLSGEQTGQELSTSTQQETKEEIKKEEAPIVQTQQPKEEKIETKEPEKPLIDEEKVAQTVTKAVLETLAPEDKEEKKDIKAKIQDLARRAADEGRELTYAEALEFLQDETKSSVKEELRAELKEEVKKEVIEDLNKEVREEEDRQKLQKKELEQRQKIANDEVDRQMKALISSGAVPEIVDKTDKNDPGMKVIMPLFEQIREWNTKNPTTPVVNVVEFFYTKFKDPNKMPEGASAPVFGAKRSVTPVNPDSYSYSEIRNASLEDLVHANG